MYKIKAPSDAYDRKIGGVQFVDGMAETDNAWLASWFSGRPGFTVERMPEKKQAGKKGQKHDEENAAGTDEAAASGNTGGNA